MDDHAKGMWTFLKNVNTGVHILYMVCKYVDTVRCEVISSLFIF